MMKMKAVKPFLPAGGYRPSLQTASLLVTTQHKVQAVTA